MTNKQKIYLAIGGAMALGLGGMTFYVVRQMTLLRNSCYSVTGAVIKKMGLNKVELTLMMKILNRSTVPVTIKKQSYNIYVNDMLVSQIRKDDIFTLEPRQSKTIALEVSFNPMDLLKAGLQNIQAIIGDKNKLIIRTEGTVTAKTGMVGVKNMKIETTMSLAELLAPTPMDDPCKNFK